ncbi:MAG TPA: GntR family transcriptional regulator, partial [Acidimicrobiales bacterium]
MSDFKSIGGTVRSRAAGELRDRILTGRLGPGTRIDLDAITREFGISRTPVREALLELSYEGLVSVTPRSGITVLGITPGDAVDNFAILATLAGKAAEWATERMTRPVPDEL